MEVIYKKMKRSIITYYWVILLLVLAACSDETIRNVVPQTSFVIQVSGAKSAESPGSRTIAEPENNIAELDVILFRRDGRTDFYYQHISLPESSIKDVGTNTGEVKQFELEIPKEITTSDKGARIMVLANCRDAINEFRIKENIPEDAGTSGQIQRQHFHDHLDINYDWTNFSTNHLPMCGIHTSYIMVDGENEMPLIAIDLLRMYARVDVGIDMYNPKGSMNSDLRKKFIIQKVYVVGYHPEGRIIRSFGEKLSDIHSSVPNVNDYRTRIVNDSHFFNYSLEFPDGNMRKLIYVPESQKLQVEPYYLKMYDEDNSEVFNGECDDSVNKQYNGIFLILEATYEGKSECFYRIDFKSRNGDFLPVLRNHKYEINITAVNSKGYNSLEEAKKAKPIDVNVRALTGLEYEIKTY